ncbi:MAG: glycosyltransferase [Deltaproteobacteria bacterium]|nr:glycosyltransferase [Deltaproteobacteria bacterium]
MRFSSFFIICLTLVTNVALWVLVSQPQNPVASSIPVNSFSFNPYKENESPFKNSQFTRESIEKDIQIISEKTRTIRIYTALWGLNQVPEIAKKYNMSVIASAHLGQGSKPEQDALEVETAIKMAGFHRNVSRLIIGNETQLRADIPKSVLVSYLKKARKRLRTQVSKTEAWDYWLNNPDLVKEVDFIAIHILPYWMGVPIEEAVDYMIDKYNAVKKAYPHKFVIIAEAGWPSAGPQRMKAVASQVNQARFVREFTKKAAELNISYNIIEAFDQPWKYRIEGTAGEHWGIMDAKRRPKFPFEGPVLEDPNWKYWAITSTLLGFFSSSLFMFRRRNLRKRGQILSVVIFQLGAALVTQMSREMSGEYMTPQDIVFWCVMVTMQVLLAIILLTDSVEVADVIGHKPLKRRFIPLAKSDRDYPFVSIHLACCKEPPEMVIATLESLSILDYPDFEVIVVDNNTPDEALWRPVEQRCRELGSRFRFFTLGKYPGFKAGALNFALKHTNPRAKVIGVIDADYVVEKDWLTATMPYFDDPLVGLVQCPQEHRNYEGSVFQRMTNDEYAGFFRIGMVQRNEDNAIIQHGTMTLVNRAFLDTLNGWAEWCITEDAELGLRLFKAGKKSIYIDHIMGRGLVPDSYEAYARQRFRWAYGAMRIMRHHFKSLFGFQKGLTRAQRYQFIKGWLPWVGDCLHMFFTFAAVVWSVVLVWDPLYTEFPDDIFIYPALALVILRIFGTFFTYMTRVKIGKPRTLLAMIAGGSLTHKIARAVLRGLFSNSLPFYRTPKLAQAAPLLRSLFNVREEFFLMGLLFTCVYFVQREFGWVNDEAVLWISALGIQTFPYLSAITAAIVAGLFHTPEKKLSI